jgi:multimeric flavodoxin WrbA
MKVAVVHGQAHKGNTYHFTHMLLDGLDCRREEIAEFNVNGIGQCVGCYSCILKDEKLCPHRSQIEPIINAIDEADVIIIDSPNYVMGMTGQLKSFCDHLGYRWMSHRPNGDLRNKIGVAVSTTAGAGASKTTGAIRTQMSWWSVGKIYHMSSAVSASSWNEVSDKKKKELNKKAAMLAGKINRKVGRVKPGIKTRVLFNIMGRMHQGMAYNPVDVAHWKKNGWIKGT